MNCIIGYEVAKREPSELQDSLVSVIDLFPIPMEVFSPDGTCLFMNRAFIDYFTISNTSDIIGHFNVMEDPFVNHKLGLSDYLKRVFSGEILSVYHVKIPFDQMDSHYQVRQANPVEHEMYQDITSFPLLNEDGTVACVIAAFITKQTYKARLDTLRAKEYIDTHCIEDFDLNKISKYAGLSRHHLTRLFKRFFDITPYNYYQEVKVEKIKESLADLTLNISEAFTSCGANYSGGFAEAFKRKTGMIPSAYRKTLQSTPYHSNKQSQRSNSFSSAPLYPFCKSKEELFHVTEQFPIPIQVFKNNGDILYINQAVLKMWNVEDTSQIIGKYNLIRDPFANGEPQIREGIRKVFQGEVVLIPDVRIPLEYFWSWYKRRSPVYDIEAIYTDILNFPVLGADGHMAYMVAVFFTSRVYQGKWEVARAQEYIENNWKEEFNIDKIAKTTCLSSSHLIRLFKLHTGITPYRYYQEIKLTRLKEALDNKNYNITQAFLSCGFQHSGNLARFFKEQVGMTPSQYRKHLEDS